MARSKLNMFQRICSFIYFVFKIVAFIIHAFIDSLRINGFIGTIMRSYIYIMRFGFRPSSFMIALFDEWRYQKIYIPTEPKGNDIFNMIKALNDFRYKPVISIVMPVYNTEKRFLMLSIRSVIEQIYPLWELCIVDDGSTQPHIRCVLEAATRLDNRIKVVYLDQNVGISKASNVGISIASGEYIAFLDHDDMLAPWALFEVVKLLNKCPHLDFIYSDEDIIDENGRRLSPFFKPGFSPDLLRSMNYITHLAVIRKTLLQEIGGFRSEFDGSQDYDLFLRIIDAIDKTKIGHIPKVLYHWRVNSKSVAGNPLAKPYAYRAAMRAINESLLRKGQKGIVMAISPGIYRTIYFLSEAPKISIIIPILSSDHNLAKCLKSIYDKTSYSRYEIILVTRKEDLSLLLCTECVIEHKTKIIVAESSKEEDIIQNGIDNVSGDYFVILHPDTEILQSDWLSDWLYEMLSHAARTEVGLVGPKLVSSRARIQNGGLAIDPYRRVGVLFARTEYRLPGYKYMANVVRNCLSISRFCLMMRRELWDQLGGWDPNLKGIYADLDLGLKAIYSGYFNVWTPYSVILHYNFEKEYWNVDNQIIELFWSKWQQIGFTQDPYFHPDWIWVKGIWTGEIIMQHAEPRHNLVQRQQVQNSTEGCCDLRSHRST